MLLNIAIIGNIILLAGYTIYALQTVTNNIKVCIILVVMGILAAPVNFMVTILNAMNAIQIYMATFNNKITLGIPIAIVLFLSICFIVVSYLFSREINFSYLLTLLIGVPGCLVVAIESKYVIYEEKGVIDDSKNS